MASGNTLYRTTRKGNTHIIQNHTQREHSSPELLTQFTRLHEVLKILHQCMQVSIHGRARAHTLHGASH